jgi:hypothetical protein
MKATRSIAVLVILAALIPALWAVVHAGQKPGGSAPEPTYAADERTTLRGLKGVGVVVENLQPQAVLARLGLTEETIRVDTELQLRQHGIRVLSPDEVGMAPGMPRLYIMVCVLAVNNQVPTVATFISAELTQRVSLHRDPLIECLATTWHRTGRWPVPLSEIEKVRAATKDVVSMFINDYLAANPRQAAPAQDDRGSGTKR